MHHCAAPRERVLRFGYAPYPIRFSNIDVRERDAWVSAVGSAGARLRADDGDFHAYDILRQSVKPMKRPKTTMAIHRQSEVAPASFAVGGVGWPSSQR